MGWVGRGSGVVVANGASAGSFVRDASPAPGKPVLRIGANWKLALRVELPTTAPTPHVYWGTVVKQFLLEGRNTDYNMSSIQQRKEEILAKKAKLAELKKQRELRQKEFTHHRQSLDVGEVHTNQPV